MPFVPWISYKSAVQRVSRLRPARPRQLDHELGIHYTSAIDSNHYPLATIAIVLSLTGRKRKLWGFGDAPDDEIDLLSSRLFEAS